MAKRSVERRDFLQIAREIVERAIGEKMDGTPLDNPDAGKNPAAVKRGRSGGIKGSKIRAAKITPEKRTAIAQKAATARWAKS